jgi:hypothetical protein
MTRPSREGIAIMTDGSAQDDAPEGERTFTDAQGERWTFSPRRRVRRGEEASIVVIARSAFQTRVVTCPREEWEGSPDLAQLLVASIPTGGSQGAKAPPPDGHPPGKTKPSF